MRLGLWEIPGSSPNEDKKKKKETFTYQKKEKKNRKQKTKEIDSNRYGGLTPPSLRILDMISMYSMTLCAVSMKKQVTTASQTPAIIIKIHLTVNFKIKKTTTRLTSSLGQGTQTPLSFDGLFP